MNINPEDEISYTTQYQESFLKYVENEYCARHGYLPVSKPKRVHRNDLFPMATASGSGQSHIDPYKISSNEEEYAMTKNVPEMTPR